MHTGLTAFTNQRLFNMIISGSCPFAFCIYIIFLCRAVHYKYSSHTLNICIKKRIREIPSSSKCYLYSSKVFPNLYCLKYFNNSFVQNSCEKRNILIPHSHWAILKNTNKILLCISARCLHRALLISQHTDLLV